MVFFNCNACGESLKKNQVEKHYLTKCRRCEVLSCVDCGKEFWGDSYQTHTKCISEEEKYSGKNYVAKVNKGEAKQEQWIQKVQSAIQKAPADPQLKTLLKRLEEFPNIPRKKAKFENFLKCSLRVFNSSLHNAVWDLLMSEAAQQNGSNGNAGPNGVDQNLPAKCEENGTSQDSTEKGTEDSAESEKKLSKRERKEERRKKMHKAEKKDRQTEDDVEEKEKSKKKGKRKKREDEEEEEDGDNEPVAQPKKKKRREENADDADGSLPENSNTAVSEEAEDEMTTVKRGKFNWAETITAVLQAKGEISLKKLRKKVLAEYSTYDSNKPEEKLLAKFNKKVTSLPHVKVFKDRVKLVGS